MGGIQSEAWRKGERQEGGGSHEEGEDARGGMRLEEEHRLEVGCKKEKEKTDQDQQT